jgi:dTDP-4-dehydrorhamnose reductase
MTADVLIVGAKGQLGRALAVAFGAGGWDAVHTWDRPEFDVADPGAAAQVATLAPAVVVNAAAWTDVDGAEAGPEVADRVYAINALGPRYLAEGCAACGAFLIQVSTNEVFPGAPGRFYREDDAPGALGTYARSKQAGEAAVLHARAAVAIARIAWLFGDGPNNFPRKIVAAADRLDRLGCLRVVDDEWGNPTCAPDAAAAIAALAATRRPGIYHVVNDGYASRYELARRVLAASGRGDVHITPIPSSEWPRPAPAPPHAVLVNQAAAALGICLRPWQEAVDEFALSLRNHERRAVQTNP